MLKVAPPLNVLSEHSGVKYTVKLLPTLSLRHFSLLREAGVKYNLRLLVGIVGVVCSDIIIVLVKVVACYLN